MGAKQQFYLLNSDGKPINDKNVDVKEYKQPFYSVIYKSTPKNTFIIKLCKYFRKTINNF